MYIGPQDKLTHIWHTNKMHCVSHLFADYTFMSWSTCLKSLRTRELRKPSPDSNFVSKPTLEALSMTSVEKRKAAREAQSVTAEKVHLSETPWKQPGSWGALLPTDS